jgi:hypothetical protein
MTQNQRQFLKDECFSLTLMAVVQRGRLYRKGSTARSRKEFHRELRRELDRLVPQYRPAVTEDDHLRNIVRLADSLSQSQEKALAGGRFRIGSAQKALNLYLKYLWCLGDIPTPLHCPFDYQVISRLPGCGHHKWTRIDSVDEYRVLVEAARRNASGRSLAEWELELYNDTRRGAAL